MRSSLPEGFGCCNLPDWPALRETARDAAPSTLAIVDPFAGSPDGCAAPELREFLADFAWIPVVAVVRTRPDMLECLRMLGRWGVSEVIVEGVEDTPAGITARAIRFAQGKLCRG